jgi:uncharacterized phiE125 gp8 family phage protein
MTLITLVPPASEPITLDEAKAHCEIFTSDWDVMLQGMIKAATAAVETTTRRRLITQDVQFRRTGLGGHVTLPVAPIQSVIEVVYQDTANVEQTLPDTEYRLRRDRQPNALVPAHLKVWPAVLSDVDTVAITLRVGYGLAAAVPADIKVALLMLIGHYFANREAVTTDGPGVEMPMSVSSLLMPHVLWV